MMSKKRFGPFFLASATLTLSACNLVPADQAEQADAVKPAAVPAAVVEPAPQAVDPATIVAQAPVRAQQKTGFVYEYPADLTAKHPALATYLDGLKAKAQAGFDKMVADYPKDDSPSANELSARTVWRIDGETDGMIVLLGEGYSYEGGAHGMHWTQATLWDKKAGKPVQSLDMFRDPAAAKAKILPAYCAMLDAERLGLRGETTPKGELFGDCPDPFESTVYPALVRDGTFTRIGFSLAPYTAGPYSEGQYNFTIAAPSVITDLLKPEYKALFQIYGG